MLIVASGVRNKWGYLIIRWTGSFKRSSSSSLLLLLLLLLSPSTKDPNKAVTGVSLAGDPRGWLGLQSRGVRFVGLRGGRDLVVVVWKGSLAGMGTQAR